MLRTARPTAKAGRLAVAALLVVLVVLVIAAPAAQGAVRSQTFSFTSAPQQFHVPANVDAVQVVAIGGHGGQTERTAPGGAGGRVSGVIGVTPGEVLEIYVGGYGGRDGGWGYAHGGARGQAPNGHDGRGGGGASAVIAGSDTPFIAGGGGGGGGDSTDILGDYGARGGAGGNTTDGAGQRGHDSGNASGGCGGCKPTGDGDAGSHTNAGENGGGGGGGGGHRGAHGGDAGLGGGGGGGGSSAVSSAVQQPAFGLGPLDCTCSGSVTLTWDEPGPSRIQPFGASTPQTTTVFTPFGTPLQARVTDAHGRPVEGSTVTFQLPGGLPSGGFEGAPDPRHAQAQTDADGVARSPAVVAGPGIGTWTALAFVDALSTPFSLTNVAAATSTTVASTASPSRSGQAVRFRATVTAAPGTGTPSGDVQFLVDGAPLGGPVPLAAGEALSPPAAALAVGTHAVSATFADAAGHFAPSEGTLRQTVEPAQTAVALTASDTTVDVGDPVALQADVTAVAPGAGTPDGQVEFRLDGAVLATDTLDGAGRATAGFTPAAGGAHAVVARYLPAGAPPSFEASDAALGVAVGPDASATTLSSSADPVEYGRPLTLTARVVATDVLAPTGTVVFRHGTSVLCTEPLAMVGGAAEATCAVAGGTLPVGSAAVVAEYGGDSGQAIDSSSGSTTVDVTKAATTTALTTTPEPSDAGAQIHLRAAVARANPGAIDPGGLVRFRLDGETIGAPVTIDGSGVAELVLTDPSPAGSMVLFEADYVGDASFGASSGVAAHRVRRAPTSLALRSSADPAMFGLPVRFTATLPPAATGEVSFHVDGAPLGLPVVLGADGTATSPSASLAPGAHEILASYSGDDRHASTTATLQQVVVVTPFPSPDDPLVPVVPVTPDSPDDPPPAADRCPASPVLTGLRRDGRVVRIVGWAGSDRAGEEVTITAAGRTAATTIVDGDGLFRATARVARGADPRYRAGVGGQHTPAARLRRPLVITGKDVAANGTLVVRGRAARRLGRRVPLRVERAPLCREDGPRTTAARTRTNRRGGFRVALRPSGDGVALYTVTTRGGRASLPFLAAR